MTGQVLMWAGDGPTAAVSAEIWDTIIRGHSERRERLRLERLIRRTDLLLDEIEQLNLGEVDRLPAKLAVQVALLCSCLPIAHEPAISTSTTPTHALDVVFDLQELIFALKTGVSAEELDGDVVECEAGPADQALTAGKKKGRKRRNGGRDGTAVKQQPSAGRTRSADAVGGHPARRLAGGGELAVRRPHRAGHAAQARERLGNGPAGMSRA